MTRRVCLLLAAGMALCLLPAGGVNPAADETPPSALAAPSGPTPDEGGSGGAGASAAGAGAMDDIHDIRPIRDPGPDFRPLAYGLGLLGAVALAVLLAWRWKRRVRRLKGGIVAALPPHEAALGALEELSDVDGMDPRRFYFRLSAVVRRYLQERYGVPAPEMTTEELIPELARLEAPREAADAMGGLFRNAAMATYAGASAEAGQMASDLSLARSFVRQTVPPEPAAFDGEERGDG